MSKPEEASSLLDQPLQPQGTQLICIPQGIPLVTDSGLFVSDQGPTVALRVVAVGPGRKKADGTYEPPPYQIGDYVIAGPRDIRLSWAWYGTGENRFTYNILMAEAVLAKIDKSAVIMALARAKKHGIDDTGSISPHQSGRKRIMGPPKKRIIDPNDDPDTVLN